MALPLLLVGASAAGATAYEYVTGLFNDDKKVTGQLGEGYNISVLPSLLTTGKIVALALVALYGYKIIKGR